MGTPRLADPPASGDGLVASLPVDDDQLVRMGRIAIATQGVLYLLVGAVAFTIARGDPAGEADQRGALEVVARQPFGKVLLVAVAVGLLFHAGWRALLAVRGEPGEDDASSTVKRLGNAGRAVLYLGLTAAAGSLVLRGDSGSGGGDAREEGWTATVLGWPAGPWLVAGAGAAVVGAGIWHASRGVTRSFADSLDLASLSDRARTAVLVLGSAGHLARGAVFALVGWFLLRAGLTHDPEQTESLDTALREVAESGTGRLALTVVAVGLVVFGVFRCIDAVRRRPDEVTWA